MGNRGIIRRFQVERKTLSDKITDMAINHEERNQTMYGSYENAVDAVLSGEFELCLSPGSGESFIRNGSFRNEDGVWTKTKFYPLSAEEAELVRKHKCVINTFNGSLQHYATRLFQKRGS